MEFPSRLHNETLRESDMVPFNRSYLALEYIEGDFPLWRKSEDGKIAKYAILNDGMKPLLLKHQKEGTLPALMISSEDRKQLYGLTAEKYLEELDVKLAESNKDNKEIARAVVDLIGISMQEIASTDKNRVAGNMYQSISRMLTGYEGDGFGDLMAEVAKLEHSIAQQGVETMVYTFNYFQSLPEYPINLMENGAMGGLLHDIGMIYVPKEITGKFGPLTEDEFKTVKKHTIEGQRVLEGIDFAALNINPEIIMNAVTEHHEREDGDGYPKGLHGDQNEISEYGRVLAIIDEFTALTSITRGERYLTKSMSKSDAAVFLLKEANEGKLFLPYVSLFIKSLEKLNRPKVF